MLQEWEQCVRRCGMEWLGKHERALFVAKVVDHHKSDGHSGLGRSPLMHKRTFVRIVAGSHALRKLRDIVSF
jgi:hypothetical protein